MSEETSMVLYFEDIIPKTGWGLYYKFMLGMACASCFANATAVLCLPIAIPLSTCESEISINILYAIYISFSFGRSIGALIVNSLCDIFGRKRLMTHSLIVNFVITFMAAFAYNYYMLVFASFFLGSSVEHQKTVVKIHLAEILPMKKRGHYLALCDLFWTLGALQALAIAYFFGSPMYVEHRVVDMRVTTWRMLFAISGGINLMLACASALLEESPRFFLHSKKEYLAILTLKQFYAINESSYGNSFDVKENDISDVVLDYGLYYHAENIGFLKLVYDVSCIMWKTVKLIFSFPFLHITITLLVLKSSLLLLNLIEVNVLLAKLVTTGVVATGSDIIYLYPLKNKTMCPGTEENKLYFNFFMISTNIVLGQLLMVWLLDYIGRRISLFLGMFVSGASFIALNFVEDDMTKMIISSILMTGFSMAVTTISVINIEVFPTSFRGTSHGVIGFLGITVSTLAIRFYYVFSEWFLIYMGCILLFGSSLTYFLQDLNQKPMVE